MANIPIADSIAYLPEIQAWFTALMTELNQIDLSKLLVYVIDDVDASALPYLGAQFDVLGFKGFRIAQDNQGRREIIKRAIELHRYKGTEWAIMEALKSIGFTDVVLIKTGYDHWAKFGILLTNEGLQLTNSSFQDITAMVNEYKRAVCVLEEIRMNILTSDSLTFIDSATVTQQMLAVDRLTLSGSFRYDGSAAFDGEYNFTGEGDVAIIEQQNNGH
jgi:P2-related tail formation protein